VNPPWQFPLIVLGEEMELNWPHSDFHYYSLLAVPINNFLPDFNSQAWSRGGRIEPSIDMFDWIFNKFMLHRITKWL
jgi:hypothetical protein